MIKETGIFVLFIIFFIVYTSVIFQLGSIAGMYSYKKSIVDDVMICNMVQQRLIDYKNEYVNSRKVWRNIVEQEFEDCK